MLVSKSITYIFKSFEIAALTTYVCFTVLH